MVLALAACHGGGGERANPVDAAAGEAPPAGDAPPVDGPPAADAPVDADQTGRVDVTVLSTHADGLPDPTAIAIFSDSTGAVVQHGLVDANGRAHAYLPQGGELTVLQAADDPNNLFHRSDRLTTIRSIEAGDHLVVGARRDPLLHTGATDTMLASFTPLSTMSSPTLLSGCAEAGFNNPIVVTFHASCVTPTFDLLTIMSDGTQQQYVLQSAIPHVPGGSFTIPATWQPFAKTSTPLVNAPSNTLIGIQLDVVIGGVSFELERKQLLGDTVAVLRHVPEAPATRLMAQLVLGISVFDRRIVVTTGSAATTPIDFASLPLPDIIRPMQTASGVTWTETFAGAPDGREIFWASSWVDANSVRHDASWVVIEPPSPATSTLLPPLPDAYLGDDPTKNPGQLTAVNVAYVDYDNLAGYRELRPDNGERFIVERQFLTVDHSAHLTFGHN